MGNVHFLLLWLLTLAWLGIRRGDPGGRWRGGAMVGVAAMIKVFPGDPAALGVRLGVHAGRDRHPHRRRG